MSTFKEKLEERWREYDTGRGFTREDFLAGASAALLVLLAGEPPKLLNSVQWEHMCIELRARAKELSQ